MLLDHGRSRLAVGFVIALFGLVSATGHAIAQSPEPYRDPPFTCEVIDYGTEAPTIPAPEDDPLCVRYDKTNATVSTLGIVDFLAAEPGRVAIVAAKCSYWQQDHWIIRAAPDTPPIVSWKGSYWYDARTGSAAGTMRDLRVGDQPATGHEFIEAVRPIIGDEQADQFREFADDGGGGGMTMMLPDGFGAEQCASAPGEDPDSPPGDSPPTDPGSPPPSTAPSDPAGRLPATGAGIPDAAFVVVAIAATAAAARRIW